MVLNGQSSQLQILLMANCPFPQLQTAMEWHPTFGLTPASLPGHVPYPAWESCAWPINHPNCHMPQTMSEINYVYTSVDPPRFNVMFCPGVAMRAPFSYRS